MTKECYLKAKEIIEHDENYSASHISFAYEQIEKWEFANQKVIEELHLLKNTIKVHWVGAMIEHRIKQLKQ